MSATVLRGEPRRTVRHVSPDDSSFDFIGNQVTG